MEAAHEDHVAIFGASGAIAGTPGRTLPVVAGELPRQSGKRKQVETVAAIALARVIDDGAADHQQVVDAKQLDDARLLRPVNVRRSGDLPPSD